MLFLHGGWVRTGTTSLQTTLVEKRDSLILAGVVYPDKWRLPGSNNHHGVVELLDDASERESVELRRFRDDLESLAIGHDAVLLSAESLTYCLNAAECEKLIRLLSVVREAMPVTCIWTLREVGDLVRSLYLRHFARRDLRGPTEMVHGLITATDWPGESFTALQQIEGAVDDVIYLKYEKDGAHNRKLLQAIGTPDSLLGSIQGRLAGRHLNESLSHKAALTLLHYERILEGLGIATSRTELQKLFASETFSFERDGPFALADTYTMERLREKALASAATCGFTPYLDFFGNETPEMPMFSDLSPRALAAEDLARLKVALEGS